MTQEVLLDVKVFLIYMIYWSRRQKGVEGIFVSEEFSRH
jgi:hypothetical protein